MSTQLTPTPGQTVGPFFHDALLFPGDRELVPPAIAGAVLLHGTVRDGSGAPVPDALVEVWQTDATGAVRSRPGSLRRDGFTFTGFGRSATDRAGRYEFSTVRPGPVAGQLPFFAMTVFAKGLLDRLFTRAYLPLDGAAPDAVLHAAGDRASTMMCVPDGDVPGTLRFDIRLQGEGETVFLTYPRQR